MPNVKLTENEARALYLLNSNHLEPSSNGYMMLDDLDRWGYSRLDLDNVKRQIRGALTRKGLAALDNFGGGVLGFRLTERAYPALSHWLHYEGGSEVVNTWF
jgi:hypothetical protein